MPWHLWYRTLLLMAWIVVYLLMEQPWTELSADTDLDTTDASFCTSPHSVQKGGSVRNGLSYHSVRSQWWRTESSARAWRRKNKLPSQSRRNSWLKHKCLRQSLQDEAESSSNGSGVGHRHTEHTSPTITNHALRYGHTLSPDRSTSKSSVSSSSAITVLMSALTSVLFCSVLLGDYCSRAVYHLPKTSHDLSLTAGIPSSMTASVSIHFLCLLTSRPLISKSRFLSISIARICAWLGFLLSVRPEH